MVNRTKIFNGYLFLILLSFLFEIFFNKITVNNIHNLIENILFALVLIVPFYFLCNKRLKKYYYIFSLSFFAICIYFETVYYYLFQIQFSSSAIFVILDSNLKEAKEFASFYIDSPIIIFTLLVLTTTILYLKKHSKIASNNILKTKRRAIMISSLTLVILLFLKVSTLIIFNLPYLVLRSTVEYSIESKKLGDYEENKNGNFSKTHRISGSEEELHVIIVGESTSRAHLEIYNYHRETTPNLKKLSQELSIYNNVISPHAFSVGSLTKMLTLGNYEQPDRISEGSIIQLMNSVGFETFWLSNQRPIGPYESMITKISLSANYHKFITVELASKSKVLDGDLINEFNEVIKNEAKKKVVFLHLMGTHHHYENRYPDSFNVFNDDPNSNFPSAESRKKINHYDNAILYNDYIISEVIRKTDSLKLKSTVLYFSDHGEEMFDDLNMAGHNEDIYSKKMFEIPFFIWQSQKHKLEKKIFFVENRKYMTDDLFHSIADLLDISAVEVDFSRSIFSKDFKERKRIIKDTINFDTFYD